MTPDILTALDALEREWRDEAAKCRREAATGDKGFLNLRRSAYKANAMITEVRADQLAALRARYAEQGWQPIATAPKGNGDYSIYILLGFAPDEEGFSPTTHEGYWSHALNRWVTTLDPGWRDGPQPTHWMPLPAPPTCDNADGHPVILAQNEGVVIKTGIIQPATMTWNLGVTYRWSELASY